MEKIGRSRATKTLLQRIAGMLPGVCQQENHKLSAEELRRIYKKGGIDSVIAKTKAIETSNDRDIARNLLRAAMILKSAAGADAQYTLGEEATKHDRSGPTLRALMQSAMDSRRFDRSFEIMRELDGWLVAHPSEENTKKRKALRRSPLNRLSILGLMAPSGGEPIQPVRGRVCYILHNSLPYTSTGYAARSCGIADGLKQAGHEVIIVTRPGFPLDMMPDLSASTVPPVTELEGIPYHRILSPLKKGTTIVDYVARSADALEAKFRELGPEFVIAASDYTTAAPALIAARRCGVRFIYEVRGFWEVTRASQRDGYLGSAEYEILVKLEGETAKRADHVFTLTTAMRGELVRRGVPPANISLLPNACDPFRFRASAKDQGLASRLGIPDSIPVIGYVGTFIDYEGLDDLAEACGQIKRQGLVFRLLLVGSEAPTSSGLESISERVVRIAEENGFDDWVIQPGRVAHAEVESYYSLIDICPFPRKPVAVCELVSPIKPLEALAMAKAVLVSSVEPLAEMIKDGETGLVFAKGNTTDLATKIVQLIHDEPLRRKLGHGGREWVQNERTWVRTGRKAAGILTELNVGLAD